MRIDRIILKDFRNYGYADVELADVTLLLGPPGAGKTSLLEAIETAITGQSRFIAKSGAGLRDDVRLGQKSYGLSLNVRNGSVGGTVNRTVTESSHKLGLSWMKDEKLDVTQIMLYQSLGVAREVAEFLLDPRLFLDRSHEEQKKLWLALVDLGNEVPSEAMKAAGIELTTVANIDKDIRALKEVRIREVNRSVKELESVLAQPVQNLQRRDLAEISRELYATSQLHKDTQRALSACEVMISAPVELKRELNSLFESTQNETPDALQSRLETLNLGIQENAENQKAYEDSIRDLETKLAKKREDYKVLRALADKAICPLKIAECSLASKPDDKELTKAETEGKRLAKKLDAERKAFAQLDLPGSRTKMEKQRAETSSALQKLQQIDRNKLALAELQVKAEEAAKDRPRLEAELESLSKKSAELNQEYAVAKAAADSDDLRSKAEEKVRALARERDQLQVAVEDLQAIRQRTVGKVNDTVVASLVAKIGAVFQSVKVEVDPYSLVIDNIAGERQSVGRKLIFDAALRVAVAEATGFDFLVIDEINRLSPALAKDVTNRILVPASSRGVQVIIAKTSDEIETVKPKSWLAVCWVQDGKVQRVRS